MSPEWTTVLDSSLRRICAWRIPPRWAVRDWFEEMRAHGAAAACQAASDYDPTRGVPFSAFVRQRVISSAFTRYRQEWAYGMRCVPQANEERDRRTAQDSLSSPAVHELLRCDLARLSAPDRWLIEQLFWIGSTEAEIAAVLGISHQAINKRKRAALEILHHWLETPQQK